MQWEEHQACMGPGLDRASFPGRCPAQGPQIRSSFVVHHCNAAICKYAKGHRTVPYVMRNVMLLPVCKNNRQQSEAHTPDLGSARTEKVEEATMPCLHEA